MPKNGLDNCVATSHSSPLQIAAVDTPRGGVIGMTLCPGKIGPGNRHPWVRNLERDLDALDAWGTDCLITLMELHELIDYQAQDLGERARARYGESGWLHLPIMDCSTPDAVWEAQWQMWRHPLHDRLDRGERIVIHCLGGLGRTGLAACRVLVERGMPAQKALETVRAARPGAVETTGRERYVLALTTS
ncbi:dual specificity protein phosphatase family protein [Aquisalimonas asiatica]|uniref:Cyclin-dependent kinase inhibitor 3 (CDKN3) n=1 Tax=Aquisalimonas asiatica TaxID=406100 RepID=A0A1H8SZW4_9GAMM|nr:dual specificity protein phosphatase family protein [Aquisalimonas asiatica]SEO84369.1 Cyclin-dependent kinase inhibitor 3 (CDKN3) [Aquisalimonas asiatica]